MVLGIRDQRGDMLNAMPCFTSERHLVLKVLLLRPPHLRPEPGRLCLLSNGSPILRRTGPSHIIPKRMNPEDLCN